MTTLDRIDPAAEAPAVTRETQLPIGAMRWLTIGVLTLAAWAGAATMAVAAAHEWTDLPILGAWVASAAATFGVPLAVFRELDRLIEAPGPGLPDGN